MRELDKTLEGRADPIVQWKIEEDMEPSLNRCQEGLEPFKLLDIRFCSWLRSPGFGGHICEIVLPMFLVVLVG